MSESSFNRDSQSPQPPASLVLEFDDLLRRCMGKQDFAIRLLNKVRTRLPEQLSELRNYCQASRCDETAMLAHELKGGTSSVGAKQIAASLGLLEQSARQGRAEALTDLFQEVEQHWRELARHLEDYAAE